MTAIRIEVTQADIDAAGDYRRYWAVPVEQAIARVAGVDVDIDGGDTDGICVATIGTIEAGTLVLDLPPAANAWLAARWGDAPSGFASPVELQHHGEPFSFDLVIDDWLVALVGQAAVS